MGLKPGGILPRPLLYRKTAPEVLDEAAADAHVGLVFGNVFAPDPHGFGEFFFLHVDSVVTVEFSGEARDKRVAEGPRLAPEIADIFHAEARLFHDFAVHGLFKALAHFHEARNQEKPRVRIVDVVGHQEFVAIADGHNHDRRDARVHGVPAFRTNYRAFLFATGHLASAAAAGPVERFPVSDVRGGSATHAQERIAHVAVRACRAKDIIVRRGFHQFLRNA